MDDLKQVILVRTDLKMSKGKAAAQVAHGSLEAALKAKKKTPDIFKSWRLEGMKKVVLKVADQKELLYYKTEADSAGLVNALVTDAGHTELPPGTKTVLAIGPDEEGKLDKITGGLKPY
jgi:PTH2 family peptidyl-tRNA hydrolase